MYTLGQRRWPHLSRYSNLKLYGHIKWRHVCSYRGSLVTEMIICGPPPTALPNMYHYYESPSVIALTKDPLLLYIGITVLACAREG